MYAPHTVTLINVRHEKSFDYSDEVSYSATVLTGVFLDTTRRSGPSKQGDQFDHSCSLIIPFDVDAGGKEYINWVNYDGAVDSAVWTLKPCGVGPDVDCYFVKGLVSGQLDYASVRSSYPDVYDVVSVRACDYGTPNMQHWEVQGR